jgi:hypothetical protein
MTYIIAAEFARPPVTKGEVLVFRRGKISTITKMRETSDSEKSDQSNASIQPGGLDIGSSVFHWEDLCYDIKVKGGERRLLDCVDGWVKPGIATALMV